MTPTAAQRADARRLFKEAVEESMADTEAAMVLSTPDFIELKIATVIAERDQARANWQEAVKAARVLPIADAALADLRERAGAVTNLASSDIRQRFGEVPAAEIRLAHAVLAYVELAIRALPLRREGE